MSSGLLRMNIIATTPTITETAAITVPPHPPGGVLDDQRREVLVDNESDDRATRQHDGDRSGAITHEPVRRQRLGRENGREADGDAAEKAIGDQTVGKGVGSAHQPEGHDSHRRPGPDDGANAPASHGDTDDGAEQVVKVAEDAEHEAGLRLGQRHFLAHLGKKEAPAVVHRRDAEAVAERADAGPSSSRRRASCSPLRFLPGFCPRRRG